MAAEYPPGLRCGLRCLYEELAGHGVDEIWETMNSLGILEEFLDAAQGTQALEIAEHRSRRPSPSPEAYWRKITQAADECISNPPESGSTLQHSDGSPDA